MQKMKIQWKKNTKQSKIKIEDIKNTIIRLKNNNLNIVCKMPINKITSDSFFEILNWTKENKIPFYYSDELFNNYNGTSNEQYLLDDKEIKHIINKNNQKIYDKLNLDLCKRKKCFDCKAGKYSMVFSYDDYIYPCFEFRQLKNSMFKVDDIIKKRMETLVKYHIESS